MITTKGKIKFAIPSRVMTGEVLIAKNPEGIGQLAVIVNRDLTTDVTTFAFLDRSKGGNRQASSFIQCYLITEGGGWFIVRLTDENVIRLIKAFEDKEDIEGELMMVQDLQTFDVMYCVEPHI